MSRRSIYTFRSTEMMDKFMNTMMEEWDLDRTSVIKLALYRLSLFMKDRHADKMDLFELVAELERGKPADFPGFGDFGEG